MGVSEDANDPLDWSPRKGAPPRRAAETREMYGKRIRSERNAKHKAKKAREKLAASPKGKVAEQAAKRRKLPGPIRDERPSTDDGMMVFDPSRGGMRPYEPGRILGVGLLPTAADPGRGSYTSFRDRRVDPDETRPREVREAEWRDAEREDVFRPAIVRTSTGTFGYDPGDLADIARIEGLLTQEPGLEDLDPNQLREALSKVERGRVFMLTVEPAPVTFSADDLAPVQ